MTSCITSRESGVLRRRRRRVPLLRFSTCETNGWFKRNLGGAVNEHTDTHTSVQHTDRTALAPPTCTRYACANPKTHAVKLGMAKAKASNTHTQTHAKRSGKEVPSFNNRKREEPSGAQITTLRSLEHPRGASEKRTGNNIFSPHRHTDKS